MSKAPKKIWYDLYSFEGGLEKLSQHDTQYIRADLVDGLVEALEWIDNVWAVEREYKAKARAALAALKEEG
jgi:hypothetical protein